MTTDTRLVASAVSPAVAAAYEVYERLNTVKSVLAPDLTDQELSLFALVANRSGLDPFAKQIHAVKRKGRVTFQTGIDGYRSIAERTREYDGSELPEFGPDCTCTTKPNPHPTWARVTVRRVGHTPQTGEAYWHEFHPGEQDFMWVKMPRNQLAKCAEALGLRKAFPYVFADIYTDDEMAQAGPAENPAVAAAAAQPTARERLAARRAAIEPQPAQDAPGAVDLPEAAEAVFAEVRADPAPAAEPVRCDSPSPYGDDGEPCAKEKGHAGNHKNHGSETW